MVWVISTCAQSKLPSMVPASYQWTPMEHDKVNSVYFSYELCVLRLNDTTYDHSATIFAQPTCLHLLADSSNPLRQISQRCWLGGKQQRQDDGICVGKQGGSIVRRGKKNQYCFSLNDRRGLLYQWSGLPRSEVSPTIDFINSILDKKYELVTFVGDSMANQLGQRLLCTCLRSNLTVQEFGNYFSMPTTGASAKVSNIPRNGLPQVSTRSIYINSYRLHNGLGCTTLHDRQSGAIPGVTKACTLTDGTFNRTCAQEKQAQFIYSKTLKGFNVGPKWAHTLHLYVLPIKLKFAWEYEPLGKALYETAQLMQTFNSTLVVVSPFAQHFKSHPLGLYENFTKPAFEEKSCGPHAYQAVSQFTEHPEMILLKRALQTMDSKWHTVVRFFNLFPLTAPLHDLHSEGHSTGWSVDCTHYIFQPTMFDAIWVEITNLVNSWP